MNAFGRPSCVTLSCLPAVVHDPDRIRVSVRGQSRRRTIAIGQGSDQVSHWAGDCGASLVIRLPKVRAGSHGKPRGERVLKITPSCLARIRQRPWADGCVSSRSYSVGVFVSQSPSQPSSLVLAVIGFISPAITYGACYEPMMPDRNNMLSSHAGSASSAGRCRADLSLLRLISRVTWSKSRVLFPFGTSTVLTLSYRPPVTGFVEGGQAWQR
jgi:hypothetical protein